MSESTIGLSWTASSDNTGVAGYKVFRDGVEIGASPTTGYEDTGLAADTTYSYVVKAYDAAGNISDPSETLAVTTLPPIPPADLSLSLVEGQSYSDLVMITGAAVSESEPFSLTLIVDNTEVAIVTGGSSLSYQWDTYLAANGIHAITLHVILRDDQECEKTCNVIVYNDIYRIILI